MEDKQRPRTIRFADKDSDSDGEEGAKRIPEVVISLKVNLLIELLYVLNFKTYAS